MPDAEEDLRQRLSNLEARVEALEEQAQRGELNEDVPGLRAFVDGCSPNSHTERALAIGYYLDVMSADGSFTIHDIIEGYHACREPEPSNPSDVVGRAGEAGWLMKDGRQDGLQQWRVTAEGERKIVEVRETISAS